MKSEVLSLALNGTTHALRYAESAARRFTTEIKELETASKLAISVGYIQDRLSDAHASLVAAEEEIRRLIHESDIIISNPELRITCTARMTGSCTIQYRTQCRVAVETLAHALQRWKFGGDLTEGAAIGSRGGIHKNLRLNGNSSLLEVWSSRKSDGRVIH